MSFALRFADTGYASLRNRASTFGSVSLPDPCETVYVIQTKSTCTPVRARLYLDLPGSTATRGLGAVGLKTVEEHGIKVTVETAELLAKTMPAAAAEEGDEEPADTADVPKDDGLRPPFPFTSCLELSRELINMYHFNSTRIVNVTTGFGQVELAALLADMGCWSFVSSAKHREAGLSHVISTQPSIFVCLCYVSL